MYDVFIYLGFGLFLSIPVGIIAYIFFNRGNKKQDEVNVQNEESDAFTKHLEWVNQRAEKRKAQTEKRQNLTSKILENKRKVQKTGLVIESKNKFGKTQEQIDAEEAFLKDYQANNPDLFQN